MKAAADCITQINPTPPSLPHLTHPHCPSYINTLQHTATQCHTLQRTALHRGWRCDKFHNVTFAEEISSSSST